MKKEKWVPAIEDRVHVYGPGWMVGREDEAWMGFKNPWIAKINVASINTEVSSGLLLLDPSTETTDKHPGCLIAVHRNQIRRLVKKIPRRIWVDASYNHPDYEGILGNERCTVVTSNVPIKNWIEFVEVIRKRDKP